MNIITNVNTYAYAMLLLFSNIELKNIFYDSIILDMDAMKDKNILIKRYLNKISKILTNLNTFIKNNELTRKEKNYLNDLRNYLMQIRNLLNDKNPENPVDYLNSLTNVEFKKELQKISDNSGTVKGKLKSRHTGEIMETERKRKNSKLNFHDKNYSFSFLIKKNKEK